MQSYQVGEIDENGFVCIGIEERKVLQGATGKNGSFMADYSGTYASGSFSDNGSDYSSSEEYSSGFSSDAKSRNSQYKKSLDFLVEQGVRVKDLPRDTN